jgi:hypothetical protein
VDFGGLLVLGLVWLLFNLLSQAKGTRSTSRRAPGSPVPPPRPAGGADPTQQEGSRLEQFLRQLEKSLDEASQRQPSTAPRVPPPRTTLAPRLPGPVEEHEDVEERESLEEPERVVSLETDVPRRERVVFDQDTGAEALVQRRIDAAHTRDRALSKADHTTFDTRIRQEPADHTAVRRYGPVELRDAIVWREILGPPVSERGSDDP